MARRALPGLVCGEAVDVGVAQYVGAAPLRRVTASMACPTASVVVTWRGKARRSNG